jgi:hypothetical protein
MLNMGLWLKIQVLKELNRVLPGSGSATALHPFYLADPGQLHCPVWVGCPITRVFLYEKVQHGLDHYIIIAFFRKIDAHPRRSFGSLRMTPGSLHSEPGGFAFSLTVTALP